MSIGRCPNIEASLRAFPRNANAAHIRSHLYYEVGERSAGLAFLNEWAREYPRAAALHCHVSWHQALWSMELGRTDEAWRIYQQDLRPDAAWGPQLNVLSDCASFLFRAELAGGLRQPALWQEISQYAAKWFPDPGVGFADLHAALAHAMAGNGEALERLVRDPKGPAADVVAPMAGAFAAFARSDWDGTIAAIEPNLGSHERFGGSRAQRDLVEYALVGAMLRSGRPVDDVARRIAARRPQIAREGGYPFKELQLPRGLTGRPSPQVATGFPSPACPDSRISTADDAACRERNRLVSGYGRSGWPPTQRDLRSKPSASLLAAWDEPADDDRRGSTVRCRRSENGIPAGSARTYSQRETCNRWLELGSFRSERPRPLSENGSTKQCRDSRY